jgi:GABA permease
VWAEISLRRRLEATAPERLAIRMWLFPYASYAVAGVIVVVLVAMAFTPELQSQFFSSCATVVLVLGAFALFRRRIFTVPTQASAQMASDDWPHR